MAAQFSHVAKEYDKDFTHSVIGNYQRTQVLDEVAPMLKPESRILEINCGTGEDALWLSQRAKTILATDISEEMVAVAGEKTRTKSNVTCSVLDANNIASLHPQTFDVIFSNFGGLNCLSPEDLREFIKAAAQLLNPGGQLMLVIMGKKSMWERIYFNLKGEPEKAQRRNTSEALLVNVGGVEVPTWYYSPSDILKLAATYFEKRKTVPIGLFIAPSFLESFFSNKRWILRIAALMDRFWLVPFADYADHYLICLQKKSA
jgi:ubiquinone/menaquinone biosynthesis C-methylase UbiE